MPLPLLWISVRRAQLAYAVFGSLFLPFLATTLLILNNRGRAVGDAFRSRWPFNLFLGATVLLFLALTARQAWLLVGRLSAS